MYQLLQFVQCMFNVLLILFVRFMFSCHTHLIGDVNNVDWLCTPVFTQLSTSKITTGLPSCDWSINLHYYYCPIVPWTCMLPQQIAMHATFLISPKILVQVDTFSNVSTGQIQEGYEPGKGNSLQNSIKYLGKNYRSRLFPLISVAQLL